MNAYWDTCYLIVFSGIRTGLHLPPLSGEEALSKVAPLLPSASIRIGHAHYDATTHVEAWPKDQSDPGISDFIATAFRNGFGEGYRKVAGIFSCPDALEKKHLEEAFLSIRPLDCSLGVDTAGGVYLLGMNNMEERLIYDQPWGQATLSKSIIREIGSLKKIMYKLPVLGK